VTFVTRVTGAGSAGAEKQAEAPAAIQTTGKNW